MKKSILLLLTVFLTSMHLYGQNELDLNKNIYKTADSLKAIGQMGSIDTPSLFE